jgi:hypothetical protein
VLAHQFLRVAGFVDPPTSFFKPSILRRVLVTGRHAATHAQPGDARALPSAA